MRKLSFLLIIVLLFSLTACSHQTNEAYVMNPVITNLTDHERDLLNEIKKSGIQVIKQGMKFTFVIPTDCFFSKDTRALKEGREKDLDRLAEFIHNYSHYFQTPKVRVSGYTDTVWLAPARDRLSLHYAKAIAEFLHEDGISANTIKLRGEGAKQAIASNHYPKGSAFNRRVEVVLY